MKTWNVTIPCTMAVVVTVEAEDEEGAKQAAMCVALEVDIKSDENSSADISEFETHEQIVKGNVFYGCLNEIEVEEA